jgi:phosphatidylethanolamine-binding protein (PEBP) family uncharacterized protein
MQTGPISQQPLPKDHKYFAAVMGAKKELSNAKKELNFSNVDKAMAALVAASNSLGPYCSN